tara:strand:+ start:69 stop:284 length:216 start_codon:yes stop_codon:yes gene_type:complete
VKFVQVGKELLPDSPEFIVDPQGERLGEQLEIEGDVFGEEGIFRVEPNCEQNLVEVGVGLRSLFSNDELGA